MLSSDAAACNLANDGPPIQCHHPPPLMPKRLLFISNLFPDTTAPYRGLDNATVLHWLAKQNGWEIDSIALRPTLSPARLLGEPSRCWQPRAGDAVLHPAFLAVPYAPKIGSWLNHRLYSWRLREVLRRKVKQHRPDIVLASWLFPDGCAAARLCEPLGLPCVLITQGSDTHQYLAMPPRDRHILAAIRRSEAVITRSRDLAKRLAAAGADEVKLHPIYNGTDIELFRIRDQAGARAELGIAHSGKIALFVGNLEPVKNPFLLLESFAIHIRSQQDADTLLVMAGKGPLRPALEKQAAELGIAGRVRFTGPLPARRIALWMSAADMLCLSSINEGFPNVILEAMASGLPVLSTDVGGIHELLNDPGLGVLVKSDLQAEYAGALSQVLTTEWDRQAIAKTGGQFSWQAAADAYDRLLASCIGP